MSSSAARYFPGEFQKNNTHAHGLGSVEELAGRTLGGEAAEEEVSARSPEASLRDLEDAVLMAQLQKGDLQALELLYDRYCGVILGVGSRLLRDAAEAEDLVQEVFLYLFRKSHVFSISKSSVGSWLIQVAYARAFDRRKWLRRRGRELQ